MYIDYLRRSYLASSTCMSACMPFMVYSSTRWFQENALIRTRKCLPNYQPVPFRPGGQIQRRVRGSFRWHQYLGSPRYAKERPWRHMGHGGSVQLRSQAAEGRRALAIWAISYATCKIKTQSRHISSTRHWWNVRSDKLTYQHIMSNK
jgi:hypothetical protein